MFQKGFCSDCQLPSIYHCQTWLNQLMDSLLPQLPLPRKIEAAFDWLIRKTLSSLGLIKFQDKFKLSDLSLRSALLIKEARKRGINFKAEQGPFGPTNRFLAQGPNGQKAYFDSLPLADFASKKNIFLTNCKERTRDYLKKAGFPFVEGRAFWAWQKNKAIKYGDQLGFPLVVKPRSGSVARHVTTGITSAKELKQAIKKALVYSPAFVIEKYLENCFVYRATLVDFDYLACVQQLPANVIGDGRLTIEELVKKKNQDKDRGKANQKGFVLNKIIVDQKTKELLQKKGYQLTTIPAQGERVYLQSDPFLRLGGDLIEVTEQVQADNRQLFKEIAKFFDLRLVGIDFLLPDISLSWKKQPAAVLELNTLPCIELHHFPSTGPSQNVAQAITDLLFKYYL